MHATDKSNIATDNLKSATDKIFKKIMNYTQNCTVCENEFQSKRPANFCSSTCRSKFNRDDEKVIPKKILKTEHQILIEKLKDIQSKYKPHEITKALLTKETGIHYTFIPNWLMHGKVYGEI